MHSYFLTLILAFASVSVNGQLSSSANSSAVATATTAASSTTVPFFSAGTVGTPLPTGPAPVPGDATSIVNTAGNFTDTFVYTLPQQTVSPTGNVTIPATGTASNLQPDPTNLQIVGAASGLRASLKESIALPALLLLGVAGGMFAL